MGNVKILYKIISGFLIFFMAVAVAVPAISSCEGICCSEEPVVPQGVCHEPMLPVAHTLPDMGMSHITIVDSFFLSKNDTSDLPCCHETNSHSCCEVDMPLATTKTHDFGINNSQTEYYLSAAVLTSASEYISSSDLFRLKGGIYLTAVRAAPVQLFLKNLSILC